MQIDAHVGGVNDIAFSHPNKQLCVVSCGDDKVIKVREFGYYSRSMFSFISLQLLQRKFCVLQVWDLTGQRLHVFEGHEAPVYSICPHHKENIQVWFTECIYLVKTITSFCCSHPLWESGA